MKLRFRLKAAQRLTAQERPPVREGDTVIIHPRGKGELPYKVVQVTGVGIRARGEGGAILIRPNNVRRIERNGKTIWTRWLSVDS